ncbi:MAG TPA: hypothetical protein VMO88_13825 [Acidimicrobiales bacterium]|nr:hypothetical protein [Acidimicrobiales bacterium]
MEHEPTSSPDPEPHWDPVYGPLQPQPPQRRFPRLALAGGLAGALALSGAGIAYAATSGGSSSATPAASNAPTSTTPPTNPGGHLKGPRGGFAFGRGGLGGLGLGGKVLHGQVTIQQPDGTVKTVEFQVGTVSAVSNSSITLTSGTGSSTYTHSYTVDPTTIVDSQAGGISAVAKGDQVRLTATQQKGSDTATDIVDVTKIQSSRKGFGFQRGDGPEAGSDGSATNPPAGSTGVLWGGPGGYGSRSGSPAVGTQVQ